MDFFCDPATMDAVGELADQVTAVEAEAAGARLNTELFANPEAVRRIADIATANDKADLLAWTVTEVCKLLPAGTPALLREAAIHAMAAVVLTDELTEHEASALSLPWSYASGE